MNGVNVDSLNGGSLACVCRRDVKLSKSCVLCRRAHRERAANRAKLARERKLTNEAGGAKRVVTVNDTSATKNTEQYRNIKAGAFLFAVGGSEIYHKAKPGELISAVYAGGVNSVVRLAHCGVGQSDEMEIVHAGKTIALDADHKSVYSENPRTFYS